MTSKCIKWQQIVSTLIIGLAAFWVSTLSVAAQCVADELSVSSVAGKVVTRFNGGEQPVAPASVKLKRGNNTGPVIAKQSVGTDGRFNFDHIKPGKYVMIVSAPHYIDFYLELQFARPTTGKDDKEVVVIMGADFTKECSGSKAELRIKERTDSSRH
jgi:hypothetical protein